MGIMDWISLSQIAANIATIGAVILGGIVFFREIRANRQEREQAILLRFIDAYEQTTDKRRANWAKVKEGVTSNPKTEHEISDKTSSLDYLRVRVKQAEPLFAIEHAILEYEITTLNLLNEVCRLASTQEAKALNSALLVTDISYYQSHLDVLLEVLEKEKKNRLFSSPRYEALMAYPVNELVLSPFQPSQEVK